MLERFLKSGTIILLTIEAPRKGSRSCRVGRPFSDWASGIQGFGALGRSWCIWYAIMQAQQTGSPDVEYELTAETYCQFAGDDICVYIYIHTCAYIHVYTHMRTRRSRSPPTNIRFQAQANTKEKGNL